MSEEETASSM